MMNLDVSHLAKLKAALPVLFKAVAIGDCAGVSFEFNNDRQESFLCGSQTLDEVKLQDLLDNAFSYGDNWVRTFSDDTVLAYLRVLAVKHAVSLASGPQPRRVTRDDVNVFFAQCIWRWRFIGNNTGAKSSEFIRYGGFTMGMTSLPKDTSITNQTPDNMRAYMRHMLDYAKNHIPPPPGKGQEYAGSWGNGVVMSLGPFLLAKAIARIEHPNIDQDAFDDVDATHVHIHARLASEFMARIIEARFTGAKTLHEAVKRELERPDKIVWPEDPDVENAIPLVLKAVEREYDELAIDSELTHRRLLAPDQLDAVIQAEKQAQQPRRPVFDARERRLGVLGRLMSGLSTMPKGPSNQLRFSQRACNTVAIGLYCALYGRTLEDVMELVVSIGGDTDSTGSVAMQFKALYSSTEPDFGDQLQDMWDRFVLVAPLAEQKPYLRDISDRNRRIIDKMLKAVDLDDRHTVAAAEALLKNASALSHKVHINGQQFLELVIKQESGFLSPVLDIIRSTDRVTTRALTLDPGYIMAFRQRRKTPPKMIVSIELGPAFANREANERAALVEYVLQSCRDLTPIDADAIPSGLLAGQLLSTPVSTEDVERAMRSPLPSR